MQGEWADNNNIQNIKKIISCIIIIIIISSFLAWSLKDKKNAYKYILRLKRDGVEMGNIVNINS